MSTFDRRTVVPWIVLAASLALTASATWGLARSAGKRDVTRMESAVRLAQNRIRARLDAYVALLRGGGGLFAASPPADAATFRAYVAQLAIRQEYPGVQGFGYSRRVRREEQDSVVSARRAEGMPEFRLWPDSTPAERHAIVYVEPLDVRNRRALGYDMFSEPTRRVAMTRARDTGEPAMSGRVRLVQELDSAVQAGFLIYLPVYRGGGVPATLDARQEALQGFVYTPFRADDFFAGLAGAERQFEVEVEVYDGDGTDQASRLHASRRDAAPPRSLSALQRVERLDVAGHRWTMVYTPSAAFDRATEVAWLASIAGMGLLVSGLLFTLSWGQMRAGRRAERYAAESRELARTLEIHADAANAANRAKSQFLANMSHELRTPLNAIAGYADLMAMGLRGPVSDEQRHDLARMKRAQRHLLGLIDDVLDFAKLEAGRVEFAIRPVRLRGLLLDAESLIAPQAAAKRIMLRHDAVDATVCVRTDPSKAQQVLLNLLSNAVKFTLADGTVRIACEAQPDAIVIRVSDTGTGIPTERLPEIFAPFVQVDADLTRAASGTGLGLTISRDLARRMGGDLTATSAVGEGSTFAFTMPRAPDAAVRAR